MARSFGAATVPPRHHGRGPGRGRATGARPGGTPVGRRGRLRRPGGTSLLPRPPPRLGTAHPRRRVTLTKAGSARSNEAPRIAGKTRPHARRRRHRTRAHRVARDHPGAVGGSPDLRGRRAGRRQLLVVRSAQRVPGLAGRRSDRRRSCGRPGRRLSGAGPVAAVGAAALAGACGRAWTGCRLAPGAGHQRRPRARRARAAGRRRAGATEQHDRRGPPPWTSSPPTRTCSLAWSAWHCSSPSPSPAPGSPAARLSYEAWYLVHLSPTWRWRWRSSTRSPVGVRLHRQPAGPAVWIGMYAVVAAALAVVAAVRAPRGAGSGTR